MDIELNKGFITIKGNKVDYEGNDEDNYYYADSGVISEEQIDNILIYLSNIQKINSLKLSALRKLTGDEIKSLKILGEI